jgi:hypothetical protein
MKRFLAAVSLAALIAGTNAPAHAGLLASTADFVSSFGGSYPVFGDGTDAGSEFIGAEFHVGAGGFYLTGVGAHLDGDPVAIGPNVQSVFVAVVPVNSATGLPNVAPSALASAALAHAVFTPSTTAGDVVIPLQVVLPEGDYATIFGAGLFGSSTQGGIGLTDSNRTIGSPNIFNSLNFDGSWSTYASQGNLDPGIRIFEVPEPASLAVLGFGVLSAGLLRRRRAG